MGPIAVRAELVEGDVTDESVALIVESCGNVAGDAIAGGLDACGNLPSAARVERVGCVCVVLIDRDDFLRIIGVDGDAGLGEVAGLRSERDDVGVGSFRRELRESVWRNCGERSEQKGCVNGLS